MFGALTSEQWIRIALMFFGMLPLCIEAYRYDNLTIAFSYWYLSFPF